MGSESDATQQLTYTMPLKSWSSGKVRRKELSGDRNMGQKAVIIFLPLSQLADSIVFREHTMCLHSLPGHWCLGQWSLVS